MILIPVFICAFGLWTLLCNMAVLCGLDLLTLRLLAPLALAGGIAWGVVVRRCRPTTPTDTVGETPAPGYRWVWLVAALAILAIKALNGSYGIFWLVCLLFLMAWLFVRRRDASAGFRPLAVRKGQIFLLACLMVACGVITYVVHRPDPDDSFFVGVISDAVAHPHLPVLGHDPLYGQDRLPLILPTYAVDSFELLTASLAVTFGGNPIFWAHAIMPTLFGALLPLAWAFLMRRITPRWMEATLAAMALLLLLGETHHNVGNFALVRLFQGKSELVSIGVPLLFACAWEFQDTGKSRDWVTLFFCTLAALGMSSSGIFVIPLALGMAAVGSWQSGRTARTLAALLPAAYPLACGLALRGNFEAVAAVLDRLHRAVGGIVVDNFGERGQYVILFGLLAAPIFAPSPQIRRRLGGAAALFLLGPLNPFLFQIFCKLATTETVWRILWSLPAVLFPSVAIVWIMQAAWERWKIAGLALAALTTAGAAIFLFPKPTLRPSNHLNYSLQPFKLPSPQWQLAQYAAKAAPPGMAVLAPENIAAWIPLLEVRPPLVSVRSNYDDQMAVRLPAGQGAERRQLRLLVSGSSFPPRQAARSLDALPGFHVGLIVCTRGAAAHLTPLLVRRGFRRTLADSGYVFFVLSGGPAR